MLLKNRAEILNSDNTEEQTLMSKNIRKRFLSLSPQEECKTEEVTLTRQFARSENSEGGAARKSHSLQMRTWAAHSCGKDSSLIGSLGMYISYPTIPVLLVSEEDVNSVTRKKKWRTQSQGDSCLASSFRQ